MLKLRENKYRVDKPKDNETIKYKFIVASLIIALISWEFYESKNVFAWYDPLDEVICSREKQAETLESQIQGINYSDRNPQVIKNNLSLMYADYLKKKWWYWSVTSVRLINYAKYVWEVFKTVSWLIDRETLDKYIKMRNDILFIDK